MLNRGVVPSIGPQNGGIAWCCTAHTACEGWPQRPMARGVTLSEGPAAQAAVSRGWETPPAPRRYSNPRSRRLTKDPRSVGC